MHEAAREPAEGDPFEGEFRSVGHVLVDGQKISCAEHREPAAPQSPPVRVGRIVLVDGDVVNLSNINRQLFATAGTVGERKALVAKARLTEIVPESEITAIPTFVTAENLGGLPIWDSDCILDAIDDIPAKVALIVEALRRGVPVISSMGAANRLDPTAFKVADISEAHTCPLAKKLRKLLAAQGITKGLDVVFSTEKPLSFGGALGSNAFVPPAAGLTLASAAIYKILSR